MLTDQITWSGFLELMAEHASTDGDNLVIPSMLWRWGKSTKGFLGLPLTNPMGFQAMVAQIHGAKDDSGFIIMFMSAPMTVMVPIILI